MFAFIARVYAVGLLVTVAGLALTCVWALVPFVRELPPGSPDGPMVYNNTALTALNVGIGIMMVVITFFFQWAMLGHPHEVAGEGATIGAMSAARDDGLPETPREAWEGANGGKEGEKGKARREVKRQDAPKPSADDVPLPGLPLPLSLCLALLSLLS